MSEINQPTGNLMPKEELAASGSGHLLLTDFDDDDKEDAEDAMVDFANQQGHNFLIEIFFTGVVEASKHWACRYL